MRPLEWRKRGKMYLVNCKPAQLGDHVFKSYWCGGKMWNEGNTKIPDSEMTPELLKALEDDAKHGLGRITVEHVDMEVKPSKAEPKKAESK